MSGIAPNGIIKLLKNCPLDITYEHTLFFNSKSADNDPQYDYFNALTKFTITNNTYSRLNKGTLRVSKCADDVYDCNYLMFQNSSYGNKWFYAFIKSVEYVNDGVCEIQFEIDVMQTWYYDYTLGQCFVEREHTSSDNVGEHIVPEKVEMGEYVNTDLSELSKKISIYDYFICVACTFGYDTATKTFNDSYICSSYDFEPLVPKTDALHPDGFKGYLLSGLNIIRFTYNQTGIQQFADFIDKLGNHADGVVAVYLAPKINPLSSPNSYTQSDLIQSTGVLKPTTLGEYTPKNKKLLTYPFNFLYVSNLQGSGVAYQYELFEKPKNESLMQCCFYLTTDLTPNPSVDLIPRCYKGSELNQDERVTITGYPQIGWNSDLFKAWLAQATTTAPLQILSSIVGGAVGGAVFGGGFGALAGAATGALASISSVVQEGAKVAIQPHQAHSNSGSQTGVVSETYNFFACQKHIRPKMAKVIDDYFTKFGYARHVVKTPNRGVRNYWCYTKTVGCVARGSVPADDMRKICEIYDKGVTFWKCYKSGCTVGDYSLDNSPV